MGVEITLEAVRSTSFMRGTPAISINGSKVNQAISFKVCLPIYIYQFKLYATQGVNSFQKTKDILMDEKSHKSKYHILTTLYCSATFILPREIFPLI